MNPTMITFVGGIMNSHPVNGLTGYLKRNGKAWRTLICLALATLACLPAIAADNKVLVLQESVVRDIPDGMGGFISREEYAAISMGLEVELVNAAGWAAKSQNDFRSYRALILGDPNNQNLSAIQAAINSKTVWGPAVSGNVILVGTDTYQHQQSADNRIRTASEQITDRGVAFATAWSGKTGFYVVLGRYFSGQTSRSLSDLLSVADFGSFTVSGVGNTDFDNAHITATLPHPALTGASDSGLSDWSFSSRAVFETWPAGFETLAITVRPTGPYTDDGMNQPDGYPYIIARRDKVLLLSESVSGGAGSNEGQAATRRKFDVDVLDRNGWNHLKQISPSPFRTYRALILGDNGCGSTYEGAAETHDVWGPMIDGNILVIGTDPVVHLGSSDPESLDARGSRLIDRGIGFALAQRGELGLYACLSCSEFVGTPPFLSHFGTFTTFDFTDIVSCGQIQSRVVAQHEALTGLTDSILSGWGCSIHEGFTVWPPDFEVLAIGPTGGNAPNGTPPFTFSREADTVVGFPYILARGVQSVRNYLSLAVDSKDNVWVSGLGRHQKVRVYNPSTGAPVDPPQLDSDFTTPERGGHGNVIDREGRIWSARPGKGLVRFIDAVNKDPKNYDAKDAPTPPPFGFGDFNIGLDPLSGDVWTARNGDPMFRFSPALTPDTGRPVKFEFSIENGFQFPDANGLAVDVRGNVWLANPGSFNTLAHLRTDGTLLGFVPLNCSSSEDIRGVAGVAVDANGKIWVPDRVTGKVFRIDPDAGPILYEEVLSDGTKRGQRLGEVDLTVDLGGDAFPDAYTDMGGMVSSVIRPDSGTWRVVHDSGASRSWQKIGWTRTLPANTQLKVEVRAAGGNNGVETELEAASFTAFTESSPVGNPAQVIQNISGLTGRFLEIRVSFARLAGAAPGATPTVKDLQVSDTSNLPPLPAENNVPLAQADSVTVSRNSANQPLNVLKNDLLFQINPADAHITLVSAAAFGIATKSADAKSVLYTPNPGFYGEDSFTYTVEDNNHAVGSALVTVAVVQLDVTPGLLPPLAKDDSFPEPLAAPPAAFSPTESSGSWPATTDTQNIRVYAYKVVAGTRYYSAVPLDTAFDPSGSQNYSVTWSLVPSPDADGYRVLRQSSSTGWSYDHYIDITSPSFVDSGPGIWTAGSVVVPAGPLIHGNSGPITLDVLANDCSSCNLVAPANVSQPSRTAGNWNEGYDHTIRVYSYITISGVRYYSPNYAEATANIFDYGGFHWQWAPVPTAQGYRVLKSTGDGGEMSFDYYHDTTDTFLADNDPDVWTGGATVTPTALEVGDNETLVLVSVDQPRHGVARIVDCNKIEYIPAPYFFGTDNFVYRISNGGTQPSEGKVTVTVTGSTPAAIGCGSSINGNLTGSDAYSPGRAGFFCDTYHLSGAAGKTVTVRLNSSDFHPYVRIRAPGGATVAEQTGSPGLDMDVPLLPRDPGIYIVEVSSADGQTPLVGNYALSVICQAMWVKFIRSDGSSVGLNSGDTLDFGISSLGSPPPPIHLRIGNDGSSALNITGLGTDTMNEFRVSLNGSDPSPGTGPLSFSIPALPAGNTKDVYLYFRPGAEGDYNNGHFSFQPSFGLSLRAHANPDVVPGTLAIDLVSPAVGRRTLPLNDVTLIAPATVSVLAEVTVGNASADRVEIFAWRSDENVPSMPIQTLTAAPFSFQWRGPGGLGVSEGDYVIAAVVHDDFQNLADVSQCLVRVRGTPTPNSPPIAVNDVRIVMADTADNFVDVLANDTDPDGDALVATLFRQAVNGVAAFNSTQQHFTYTPKAGFSGEDSFAYSISDQHGGTDSAIVTVHVADSSVALVSPTEGATFQLPVSGGGIPLNATATAAAGATIVRVRFFVDNQMIGQDTTASGNTYSFTWANPTPGKHVLAAAIVDGQGRQRYSTPVRISISDIGAPTVAITNPQNNDSAQLPVSTGHAIRTITATANAAPGATMSKVKFYVDNDLIGEDTSASGGNVYSIAWNDIRYGEHELRAVAFDTQGRFKVSNPITVTLTRDANNVPPIAKIVCPDEPPAAALGEELVPRVRRDRLVVRGLAYDPTGQEVTYQVLVTDVDGNIVAKSDPVTGPGVTTGPSTPCADPDLDDPANSVGRVGVVSLTGLLNGRYNANLVVSDQSDVVVATVCFLLESDAKVGHFSFSQTDLSVPVNGIPLRVIRNYNSRNLKSGDFGFSWTYSMLDMDIELDEIRQTAFDADAVDFSDPYSMRVGGSRNVTLTLPNGRRATFRFEPGNCGNGCFTVNWVAAPGVTARLVPIDKYRNEIHNIYGGFPFVSFESGRTPFQNSDVPGFKLVTQDGTQYILEREDFGERFPLNDYTDEDDDGLGQEFDNMDVHPYGPPFLAEIIQPSGERITFERNGTGADGRPLIKSIEHKSAGGAKMASLAIRRDTEGRINKIFDPNSLKAGLDANGEPIGRPALTYEYDDAGNLWRVLKLIGVNGSTPSYQTYEFKYENPDPRYRHFITKILDGNGRPVAVNEYDDQGRLKRVTDVDGFTSVIDRDGVPTIGVGVETVTDHWGNTRTIEYDAHGNVVLSIDPLNHKVRRVFDNDKNTVSETLAPDGTLLARSDLDIEYFPNSAAVKKVTAKQRKVVNGSVVPNQDIVVEKEFNSAGRTVKIVDRMGSYAAIAYNGNTKPDQIQTFNSQGQLLQSSVANHYNTFGSFTGLLDYSEDALGNRHVNSYYNGTEPESGGAAGRLRKVERQDPQGNLLSLESFTYDENGNILTTAKARNNASDLQVSQSFYNGVGQVERTIEPELGESRTFYTSNGEVESVQDRYGNRTSYLHNRKGDPIQTMRADGSVSRSTTVYGYGSNGKGRAIVLERPHFEGDPVYGTRTEYDSAGRVIRVEELKNFRINISPDGPNYASTFEELSGGVVVIATSSSHYDDAGRVDTVTDSRGNTTTYTYDGYGRRETATTWVTTPTARERTVRTSHYDSSGNDQGITLVVTRFSLSDPPTQIGSPITVSTPSYQYDALNRRWLTTHEDNSYTRSIYDQLGRRVEEIEPDGVSTRFEYDGVGQLLAVTRPYKIYNPADLNDYLNPEVVDPNPVDQTITRYKYDLAGNLVRQTDANQTVVTPESAQKHTAFQYDKLGRRTMRTLPGTQPETWQYDTTISGQLVQQVIHTDFNLVSVLEEFDEMGRLSRKTPQVDPLPVGWLPLQFTYTATGNRRTMSDSSGVSEYEYDDRDRLWKKTVEKGTANYRTLTYAYDLNSNIESITSSSGETALSYAYDEQNRLKSVNGTTYTYDPAGNLQTVAYPNQVVTRYNYDSRNRLGLMTVKDGSDATLASFEYDDYDTGDSLAWPSERRLARTGERQGAAELIKFGGQDYRRLLAYDHDPLRRLRAERLRVSTGANWPSWAPAGVPATASTGDILYDVTPGYTDLPGGNGYDRVGNRRSRTVTDQALIDRGISSYSGGTAQTFDPNDRLTGGINDSDANGNTRVGELLPLSGVVLPNASHKDEYDYENHLIKRSDGTTTIKIVYDGDGNRVRKTIETGTDSTVIRYLADDKNPTRYFQVLEEWQSLNGAPNTLRRAYVYGHDLVSQRDANNEINYYGYDGRGNVRLLLSSGGIVTDTYSYDAFGTVIHELHQNALNPTQNDYRFSGEQWDPQLGMYFLRARYLNPRSGRFWTMDSYQGNTEEPVSLHKYLYASDNPVNRVDPSGKFDIIISALSMAADVLGYALNPGREFEATPDTGFEIDQEELDNADEEALIEIHLASQEWLLLVVNAEVQRGMEAMAEGEDAMWDAFFATWDFNEEVIWDLIESVSYVKACFVAGTPIVVGTNIDGSYITRPIEELRQDDPVLARDEHNAQTDLRFQRVMDAFSRQVDHLRILTVRNVVGNETTIRTTDEHPFWVIGQGWMVAGKLVAGDRLQGVSGNETVEVLSSTRENFAQAVQVYNLTVDGDHTYFVSDSADGGTLTVWVHNGRSCKNNVNLNNNKAKSKFGVYEIWIDGKLHKIGKADLNRITKSSKYGQNVPTRLHQQLRRKERTLGEGRVTGKVEEDLGETTTASAKAAEKARIDRWVNNGNPVPPGNARSYRP